MSTHTLYTHARTNRTLLVIGGLIIATALAFTGIVLAHTPTLAITEVNGQSVDSPPVEINVNEFPVEILVSVLITHDNPANAVKDLTLFVNGSQHGDAVTMNSTICGTGPTCTYDLPWIISESGDYSLFVTAYHGNKDATTGTSAIIDIDIPEPVDTDGDGIPDGEDNCPFVANSGQEDSDGDGIGDVCDTEADEISCSDGVDNDGDDLVDLADPDCEAFVPADPTIQIVKVIDGDGNLETSGDQTSGGSGWTFEIDADEYDTDENGETVVIEVLADTYNIVETTQTGYDLVGASCEGATENGIFTEESVSGIEADSDQTIVCTFYNAPLGSITVTKETIPASENEFSFSITDFENFVLSNGLSELFENLLGAYTITESENSDYTTDVFCDNDTSGGSSSVEVSVGYGDDVTCTFTNVLKQGGITIVKQTNPGDSEESFEFSLSWSEESLFLSDEGFENYNLDPGTYTVEEVNLPDGWTSDVTCIDEEENEQNQGELTLNPDGSIVCTFVNTQLGTIVIKKVIEGIDSDSVFYFESDINGDFSIETSGGTGQTVFDALEPGVHSISEIEEELGENWTLTSLICDDESDPSAIDLAAGETVTCTFINTYEEQPSDIDDDGIIDEEDNCIETYNPEQEDADDDGIGDVCDETPNGDGGGGEEESADTDEDGIPDESDNCVNTPNEDQADADGDGIGDVCDETPGGDPEPEDNGGGGGGSSGGGGGTGGGGIINVPAGTSLSGPGFSGGGGGQVLGETIDLGEVESAYEELCGDEYLKEYIKLGRANNPEEVKKLQDFLNRHMAAGLPVTGFYGSLSYDAVKDFQLRYFEEVLLPWVPYGLPTPKTPTGYVYKTTKRWINMLECPALNLPYPNLSPDADGDIGSVELPDIASDTAHEATHVVQQSVGSGSGQSAAVINITIDTDKAIRELQERLKDAQSLLVKLLEQLVEALQARINSAN